MKELDADDAPIVYESHSELIHFLNLQHQHTLLKRFTAILSSRACTYCTEVPKLALNPHAVEHANTNYAEPLQLPPLNNVPATNRTATC